MTMHQRFCVFGDHGNETHGGSVWQKTINSTPILASPSATSFGTRASSRCRIKPGDTVLIPDGTGQGKLFLCIAWSVPRDIGSHLQPLLGRRVHFTPPVNMRSTPSALLRFKSTSKSLSDLISVPTEPAQAIEVLFPESIENVVPSTSLKARVVDLLDGCVVASGFSVELGVAGCIKELSIRIKSTRPASCAVKVDKLTTRISLTCDHGANFRDDPPLERNGSEFAPRASKLLRGPTKELCELFEGPVLWAKYISEYYFGNLQMPRGVLLSGPPGVGKTRAVRLACRERDPRVNLHLFSVNGSDIFTTSSLGGAEAVLRDVFARARKHCESEASAVSVIFIDEIDVVCPKRDGTSGSGSGSRSSAENVRVVSQLLTLLDGVEGTSGAAEKAEKSERRLIVVAATNRPNVLDPALRRPGRFDREIRFPPPDQNERLEILRNMVTCPGNSSKAPNDNGASAIASTRMKGVSLRPSGGSSSAQVVLTDVASRAIGFTGADLQSLVREAAMCAVTESRTYINEHDFEHAFTLVSGPSSGRGQRIAISGSQSGTLNLDNLGGMKKAKLALQKAVLWPVQRGEAFARLGAKPPRGILLHGPPGCGKTSIVMATAAAAGATTFLTLKPSDVYSAYVGDSEAAVRSAFKHARDCLPAMLFLDELDAIVGSRGLEGPSRNTDNMSGVQARVLSTLLNEMDGVVAADGLTIIAATNRLDSIDAALLRPGRFGCHIAISLPDASEREDILRVSCRDMPVSGSQSELSELFCALAKRTKGRNAAELSSICREAAMVALRDGRVELTKGDFVCACDNVLVSG